MNKEAYKRAMGTLSKMIDEIEEKNKIIENLDLKVSVLEWKINILSKVVSRAGIDIDDYISIEDISHYTNICSREDG